MVFTSSGGASAHRFHIRWRETLFATPVRLRVGSWWQPLSAEHQVGLGRPRALGIGLVGGQAGGLGGQGVRAWRGGDSRAHNARASRLHARLS